MKTSEPISGEKVRRVQAYLERFGYYTRSRTRIRSRKAKPRPHMTGTLDGATKLAIRRFEKFHGLSCTGKLTPKISRLMSLPRCGNPDLPVRRLLAAWPDPRLTYGFHNFTSDLSEAAVRRSIRMAADVWSAASSIVFEEVPMSSRPIIRIGFFTGDHGDGRPFDGPDRVLGHAFPPPDPSPFALSGDVHFDDAEHWTDTIPSSDRDLVSAAIHELGHAIGLEHSTNQDSVMFPILRPRRTLHSEDVAAVQSLYGGRWISVSGKADIPRTIGRGPRKVVEEVVFSASVARAMVGLRGFSAGYTDKEEHNFGRLDVGAKVLSAKGNRVTFAVWLGLRDWTGNWDDAYEGRILYSVMAEIGDTRKRKK